MVPDEDTVPDDSTADLDPPTRSRTHATFTDALAALSLAMLEHRELYYEEHDL